MESKIERDTEFLYNMLNSFFSLINEKAKVSMSSSESVDSPYYAAIRQFIMNTIQQHQPATRASFIFIFLILQPHYGIICYLIVIYSYLRTSP